MTFAPGDILESHGRAGIKAGVRWTIATGPTPFFNPRIRATTERYIVVREVGDIKHCDVEFLERNFTQLEVGR